MYNTPFSTVGYITYKRTYARRLDEADTTSKTEEFPDTVERVIKAANDQLGCGFTADEQERLRKYLMELKGTVAGRFLWQMGTDTVGRLGLASLQNCAFTVIDEPVRPFTWAMDLLMLGSGVGYNIQRKNVEKLPEVNPNFTAPTRLDSNDADFIVPDSREGWVSLLGKTLKAAFLSEKKPTFTYSTVLVRGRGAAIKGFGGTASGPEDLCDGIAKVSSILEKRAGKKLRPIDCLDIMNIIGMIVVSGNVRRCLPKGALVHTESGLIPIENVKTGMNVLTTDGYHSVKNTIAEQAPVYNKVMKDYTESSDLIKEIERTLSLDKKASISASLNKLQSLMRNNVNTNYGYRQQIADELISKLVKINRTDLNEFLVEQKDLLIRYPIQISSLYVNN